MRIRLTRSTGDPRSGSALLVGMVAALAMGAMAFSLVAIGVSGTRQQHGVLESAQAKYVCEAALNDAVFALQAGASGDLGSADLPQTYGEALYWVEAVDLSPTLVQLVGTGRDDRAAERQELVVRRVIESMFTYAVFGEDDVHLDSNAKVDSYDSTAGTYASQALSGSGAHIWANENGNIGCNADISVDSNAVVHGDATPGPSGATTTADDDSVTGSVLPAEDLAEFPPIVVPAYASSGPLDVTSDTTLASGNYQFTSLHVDGNDDLLVIGPAKIVCDSFDLDSNSTFQIDATNGGVEIWVMNDFTLDSNTIFGSLTQAPADLKINLLSDNIIDPFVSVDLDDVDFDSNAVLYGTIYAPNAKIEIDSNFELFGALIAKEVDLDSNCKIHYDEALALIDSDGVFEYEVVTWRPLACDLD